MRLLLLLQPVDAGVVGGVGHELVRLMRERERSESVRVRVSERERTRARARG